MSANTSQFQQAMDRINEQSPVVRWGLVIVAAIILYFVWSGLVAPTSRAWGESAEAIQRQVNTVRERDRMAAEIQRMQDTIITLGPVDAPAYIEEGRAHVLAAVHAVQNTYRMSNDSFSLLDRGSLPRGTLQGLSVMGQPTQLTGEFRFDATPDDAIAIIAALESRPEIARISTVHIQRLGGTTRRVNVRLTIEAWVVSTETGRGRRI